MPRQPAPEIGLSSKPEGPKKPQFPYTRIAIEKQEARPLTKKEIQEIHRITDIKREMDSLGPDDICLLNRLIAKDSNQHELYLFTEHERLSTKLNDKTLNEFDVQFYKKRLGLIEEELAMLTNIQNKKES